MTLIGKGSPDRWTSWTGDNADHGDKFWIPGGRPDGSTLFPFPTTVFAVYIEVITGARRGGGSLSKFQEGRDSEKSHPPLALV